MTHMHDEGFGFDPGQQRDVGKDVCPGRPSVHVGTEASHACTHALVNSMSSKQAMTCTPWLSLLTPAHIQHAYEQQAVLSHCVIMHNRYAKRIRCHTR